MNYLKLLKCGTLYCGLFICILSVLSSCDRKKNSLENQDGPLDLLDSVEVLVQDGTKPARDYLNEMIRTKAYSEDSLLLASSRIYEMDFKSDSLGIELRKIIDRPHTDKSRWVYIKAMARLADNLATRGHAEEASFYCVAGDSLAYLYGYPQLRATFRFIKGASCLMRDNKRAIQYISESLDMIKDEPQTIGIIRTTVRTTAYLMNAYVIDGNDTACIRISKDLLAYIDNLPDDVDMNNVDPTMSYRFNYHTLQCASYARLGMVKEAGMEYAEALKYFGKSPTCPVMLSACLNLMGRKKDCYELLSSVKSKLEANNDTLSHQYLAIVTDLADCYASMGDYKAAYETKAMMYDIHKKIYQKEVQANYAEWETRYKTQEKETALADLKAESKVSTMLNITLALLLLACILVIWGVFRYTAKLEQKDKTIVQRINDTLDLKRESGEFGAVVDQVKGTVRKALSGTEAEESVQEEAPEEEVEDPATKEIERFIHELKSRKLYCNPEFRREELLQELRMNKRTFAHDFEAYTGMQFAKYVSNLRVEYAADRIRRYPNYTIEAIALESGIASRASFYRAFADYFGITPTEYRRQLLALS